MKWKSLKKLLHSPKTEILAYFIQKPKKKKKKKKL